MATTFNMLRANDLIWSFVVNNYLLGKEPFPFDLLYWNANSTRMPAAMHSFYLRNMYQENKLVVPGGITLAGVPIDLRKIQTPSFILSTARGPHRAVEIDLCRDADLSRAGQVRARRPRATSPAWSIRRQPANTAIGRTRSCRRARTTGSPARAIDEGSWWPAWEEWVAQYAGGTSPGAQARRRQAEAHRGRAGLLCPWSRRALQRALWPHGKQRLLRAGPAVSGDAEHARSCPAPPGPRRP